MPGHRFADLSEYGFGVALLTDCKYGYSTFQNQMRISLLAPPTAPDPDADIGRHSSLAVMPHTGGWREAGVVAEWHVFRDTAPMGRRRRCTALLVWVDDPNLVLDTVKRAEDSDALVLRLYEAHGARGTAHIRVGVPFTAAESCNLLEDAAATLAVNDGVIELAYAPHQILTVLLS